MASDSDTDGSLPGLVSTSEDEEDDSSHRQKPAGKKNASKEEEEKKKLDEKKKADAAGAKKKEAEKPKPPPSEPRVEYGDKKAFPRDKYPDAFKICGSKPDKDKRTEKAKTAAENFDAAEPNAVKFDDRRRDDDKWGPAASKDLKNRWDEFQEKNEKIAVEADSKAKASHQNLNPDDAMAQYDRARRAQPFERKHHANYAALCLTVRVTQTDHARDNLPFLSSSCRLQIAMMAARSIVCLSKQRKRHGCVSNGTRTGSEGTSAWARRSSRKALHSPRRL
jgi:hypothetical protein